MSFKRSPVLSWPSNSFLLDLSPAVPWSGPSPQPAKQPLSTRPDFTFVAFLLVSVNPCSVKRWLFTSPTGTPRPTSPSASVSSSRLVQSLVLSVVWSRLGCLTSRTVLSSNGGSCSWLRVAPPFFLPFVYFSSCPVSPRRANILMKKRELFAWLGWIRRTTLRRIWVSIGGVSRGVSPTGRPMSLALRKLNFTIL